jgi:hypothetical protein
MLNLDPTIITSTWIPPLDYPCQVCQRTNDVDQMLLCDNYNGGYHLFCLKSELIQLASLRHLVLIIMFSSSTLIFIQTMPRFSCFRSWGGIHENFISTSSCALYIYVRPSLFGWLVSTFHCFSLFAQWSLLWIYTLTTLNVMTLHITIVVMSIYMASYMMVGYRLANHALRVNVRS